MIVSILVGQQRSQYSAHKEILITRCPFFAKCLSVGMKEANSNEVEFPDDTCLAFNLFFLWIYFEQAPVPNSHEDVLGAMHAWILADKFCMCDWQNVLIDGIMVFWSKTGMAPGHLSWLCDHSGHSSAIFELGMNQLIWNLAHTPKVYEDGWAVDLEDLLTKRECSPGKLLCSVLREIKCHTTEPAKQGCKYHVHLDEKRCPRAR